MGEPLSGKREGRGLIRVPSSCEEEEVSWPDGLGSPIDLNTSTKHGFLDSKDRDQTRVSKWCHGWELVEAEEGSIISMVTSNSQDHLEIVGA